MISRGMLSEFACRLNVMGMSLSIFPQDWTAEEGK